MDVDWAADVKKYAPDADDGIIAGIVRYCGIALRNRDSALVSFSDAKEAARVRDNFLRKKLALTQTDEVLDTAIAAVGERMKGDNTKNRVTAYYLLADSFDQLHLFQKAASAKATGLGSAKKSGSASAAAAGSAGMASLDSGMIAKPSAKKPVVTTPLAQPLGAVAPPPPAATTPAPEPVAAPVAVEPSRPAAPISPVPAPEAPRPLPDLPAATASEEKGGLALLPMLLAALAVLVLIWWLFLR